VRRDGIVNLAGRLGGVAHLTVLELLTTPFDCWYVLQHMGAVPLVRRRVVLAKDAFVEVAIWRVDEPVSPARHHFKYRLAYVVGGECVLRYDNERGKGDHRHNGAEEASYPFSTPAQLMADFATDIERWNDEHGRS